MKQPLVHRIFAALVLAVVCAVPPLAASPASAAKPSAETARSSARNPAGHLRVVGGMFGGVTDDGLPVAVQLSRNGTEIVRMAAAVKVTCRPSGLVMIMPVPFAHVPLSAQGTFRDRIEGSENEVSITATVAGRFNSSRSAVTATWALTLVGHGGAGTDTCESGPSTFTATR
jgi:hypothetical protein